MPRTAAASSADLSSSSMSSHTFNDRTLPLRAPSSVTLQGASRSARRHRSTRSHHGAPSSGYSGQVPNEFPVFSSGDVEIVVAFDGQDRRYLLHKVYLTQNSSFFARSLSEAWSGESDRAAGGGRGSESSPQTDGTDLSAISEDTSSVQPQSRTSMQLPVLGASKKPVWRYELDSGRGPDDIPMLVRKKELGQSQASQHGNLFGGFSAQPRPPPARSKPPASSNGFFRTVSAMQSVVHVPGTLSTSHDSIPSYDPYEQLNDTLRDYDNMFRIFYNHPPILDSFSITEAYIQCKTLLTLADMYDALEVVGPRIDHHLLQFQGKLWKQIAKYPPSYLKLGYLARSKTIFGEAVTHVVGQWPAGAVQLSNLPRPVLDLIEDKADDLDELRSRLEGQLFRLTLVNSRGERAGPALASSNGSGSNSVSLDWLAVSLFRHWLAENLPPPPLPISAGSGTTANPNPAAARMVSWAPLAASSRQSHQQQQQQSSTGQVAGNAGSQQQQSGQQQPQVPTRSSLVPATGRAFRLLGQGKDAYLVSDELKRYLKVHYDGYDREQLKRFKKRINDLQEQAQTVVRPLTQNALQLDVGAREGGGLGYLTCAGVGEGEWPWR